MVTQVAIAEAEVIPYWLPFRRDYVTSRGRLARREMVLLRLRDPEGVVGWGEAVPLALRGGADLQQVTDDLTAWSARATSGDAAHQAVSAPARCAILTALADLEAKRREIPLWLYLGAVSCEPVPCNATLISGTPDQVAADAERWASEGFSTFKLKVGLAGKTPERHEPDPDLQMIEAVRERVGPAARIRLDANGAWTVERAHALLRAAAPLGIELVEQPVPGFSEMAELRQRLREDDQFPIPIAGDESVNSPEEAQQARLAGACELATVKLSKLGQLLPNLGGALPLYLSSALDGPIGIAAAAHAYQALDEATRASLPPFPAAAPGGGKRASSPAAEPLAQGLATSRLFAETVASRECHLEGHELHLPIGPGLGVEIDEEALQAHRI